MSLPPWLRFILVLPAAVGAFLGAQLLLVAMAFLYGLSFDVESCEFKWLNISTKFLSAVLPPYYAVQIGAVVAPTTCHLLAAVLLSVLYALAELLLIVWAAENPNRYSDPFWWLVASGILGVAATVFACAEIAGERDEGESQP